MDVTRRYVRDAQNALSRTRASESELLHIVNEIRHMRRNGLTKTEKANLSKEDAREEAQLRSVVVENNIRHVNSMQYNLGSVNVVPSAVNTNRATSQNASASREKQESRWERAEADQWSSATIDGERYFSRMGQ